MKCCNYCSRVNPDEQEECLSCKGTGFMDIFMTPDFLIDYEVKVYDEDYELEEG